MLKTILFIDDESNILNTFKRVYRKENFNLLFATSAQEAIQKFKESPIEIIVSDYRMPSVNGMELLEILESKGFHFKAILLSGDNNLELLKQKCSLKSVFKILQKPIDSLTLLNVINEIIANEEES